MSGSEFTPINEAPDHRGDPCPIYLTCETCPTFDGAQGRSFGCPVHGVEALAEWRARYEKRMTGYAVPLPAPAIQGTLL